MNLKHNFATRLRGNLLHPPPPYIYSKGLGDFERKTTLVNILRKPILHDYDIDLRHVEDDGDYVCLPLVEIPQNKVAAYNEFLSCRW